MKNLILLLFTFVFINVSYSQNQIVSMFNKDIKYMDSLTTKIESKDSILYTSEYYNNGYILNPVFVVDKKTNRVSTIIIKYDSYNEEDIKIELNLKEYKKNIYCSLTDGFYWVRAKLIKDQKTIIIFE